MPSDPVKIDLAYKKFSKKQYTSTQKRWNEEFPGKTLNIKSSELWADTIPLTPPSTSNSIVEVVDIVLTEDLSVDDQLSWLVCQEIDNLATRLGDFIQPDKTIPQAYYIRLFDNSDTQIYIGDQVEWEFNYPNGILTFTNTPTMYQKPFKLKGYRYIGKRGVKTTLNSAYSGDGDGQGRIINVDFGPVQLTSSNGSAALQIDPVDYTPDTDLAEGQLINKSGIFYLYDSTRGKWLSMNRQTVIFGVKRADGCYLNVSDFSSSMAGWPAMRDCTITGITAQASAGYPNKSFILSKNNNPSSLLTFSLTGLYYVNGNLNIDFVANDLIKILATSQNGVTHNVIMNVEIAWRC